MLHMSYGEMSLYKNFYVQSIMTKCSICLMFAIGTAGVVFGPLFICPYIASSHHPTSSNNAKGAKVEGHVITTKEVFQ